MARPVTEGPADADARVRRVYGALGQSAILPKGLVGRIPALRRVPRFVAEFLLARRKDPEASTRQVADYLARMHPSPADRQLWLHALVRDGRLDVIDLLEARVHALSGMYTASLGSLGLTVALPPQVAEDHPGLLAGGLWGRVRLERAAGEIVLAAFTPVQVAVRMERFLEGRFYFSAAEWIDLLLTSAGYAPDALAAPGADPARTLRLKLLMLCRLAPLAEPNLNLMEMGPRSTGKTYLLRNLSPQVHLLSGGRATAASLFVNLSTRAPGILAQRKVAVFDEVARLDLGGDENLAALKDFLESGQFSRGGRTLRSECSVVWLGNLDVAGDRPSPRYRHLFEMLPPALQDTAFLDRIHGYLPGWELPKVRSASFAAGLGFVSDYFGEALLQLRDVPFAQSMESLTGGRALLDAMTQRDALAVERLARALLKIVFPNGAMRPEDPPVVEAILSLAGELRQRVHDQLCVLAPGEFAPRELGYAGVPRSDAPDLSRARQPARVRAEAARPGLVYALDRAGAGDDRRGRLLAVEASLLPGGAGLSLLGVFGPEGTKAARLAHAFLVAHLSALGLPPDWLARRRPAVQLVDGPPADGGSLALAVFLSLASLLVHEAAGSPAVAVGGGALLGETEAPADLADRMPALIAVEAGTLFVGRWPHEAERPATPPGWRVRWCDSMLDALGVGPRSASRPGP